MQIDQDRLNRATVAGKAAAAFILFNFLSVFLPIGKIETATGELKLFPLSVRIFISQVMAVGISIYIIKSSGYSAKDFLKLKNPLKALKFYPKAILLLAMVWPIMIVVGAICGFFIYYFTNFKPSQHLFTKILANTSDPLTWLVLVFSACIIAPICEEIIFRGCLFPFFNVQMGKWPAVLLTSLVFGVIHMNVYQMMPIFVLAIVLQLLFIRYRNLYFPILFHSIFNGFSLLIVFASKFFDLSKFIEPVKAMLL